MPRNRRIAGLVSLLIFGLYFTVAAGSGARSDGPEPTGKKRPFRPFIGDRWVGFGIAYGPHRDGQYPGGPGPTAAQLREDLTLIEPHWNLIRIYQSAGPLAERMLRVIAEADFDIKVVLGAWIAPEERRDEQGNVVERFPDAKAANRREVETAIRLAAAYPDIIVAISVGNETQVYWSAHRSPIDILIDYVREVRHSTEVPVAVADDFNFWNKPESRAVAREIDFIMMHAHPLWNGLQLDEALDWTVETVASIQAFHPDLPVVLAEAGWATQRHTEGEQATLMKGRVGEREQKIFYDALAEWVAETRTPTFFFEAFDENWKGGDHPDEVEKHWGVFRADRSPKAVMEERD